MDIKEIVEKLIEKHQSNNPFMIAKNLGIIILYGNFKETLGFFSHYKRSKFIHLNANAPEKLQNFICAHELAHALLHPYENTPFLKKNTLFSTEKIERQANVFAVELLLPDSLLQGYADCSLFSIAKQQGIPEKLVTLKNFLP